MLNFSLNKPILIKSVILFSDKLFDGESLYVYFLLQF